MIEISVREIERNSAGKRIVKVVETDTKYPYGVVTNYVVHAPSHLVPTARVNGKFSKTKTFAPCVAEVATGWMVEGRYPTLAAARASIGINTSPKRASAVAAALKLAA